MKKILLLAIVAMMSGCAPKQPAEPTPAEKAQKAIEAYNFEMLRDPSSYQLIELGQLDSVMTKFDNDVHWKKVFNVEESNHILGKMLSLSKSERDRLLKERDSIQENWIPQLCGWKARHKYRATNGFGALDIYVQEVFFDVDITSVTKIEDI